MPGGSILITSAPKTERPVGAAGPAMKLAKSRTFSPENTLSPAITPPESGYFPCGSLSCEFGRALLEECRGAFLLVLRRGAHCEQPRFDEQAFGYARLESFIHRFERVLHAQRSVDDDLVERGFTVCD